MPNTTSFFVDLGGDGVPTDNSNLNLQFAPDVSARVALDYAMPLAGLGALHLRNRQKAEARQAFAQALERVPNHRLVQMVLLAQSTAAMSGGSGVVAVTKEGPFDQQFGAAIAADLMGHTAQAAKVLEHALASAPPGNAGWLLPVEPLLNVSGNADAWAPVLARLRTRAA